MRSSSLYLGDMRDVLTAFEPESIDAVVTDPPYELGFMGKKWDGSGVSFDPETWRACFRVLKPGGHLLAFGGTRTVHRIAVAIEDAGFEIRDQIAWLFGSGFPKSLDVGKAIDKRRDDLDAIYRVTEFVRTARDAAGMSNGDIDDAFNLNGMAGHWTSSKSQPAVPTMPQWFALKALLGFGDDMDAEVERLNRRKGTPGEAWYDREVIGETDSGLDKGSGVTVAFTGKGRNANGKIDITAPATDLARQYDGFGTALKPAMEPIVVARKPLIGTVAANVTAHGTGALNIDGCRIGTDLMSVANEGRWPANVALDEEAAAMLDAQSGERPGMKTATLRRGATTGRSIGNDVTLGSSSQLHVSEVGYDDTGGASRFYYVAKANSAERHQSVKNHHPTVKPIALMRWLIRLVSPPDGALILDPFLGSGTTGVAAVMEDVDFVGIEQSAEYLEIAQRRIEHARGPLFQGVTVS